MTNVLYLINYAGKGGTERYVYTLIEKLHNKKIKAFFAYNEEGPLVEKVKALGVDVFQIKMSNPFDLKAAYRLGKYCKENKIDVIHSQFLRENYISILSKLFNPSVKTILTNHILLKNNFILKQINSVVSRFNHSVITVCNIGKEILAANGIKRSKIKIVHNGVDFEYWGTEVKSDIRERFGVGANEFIILCSSRFTAEKGHAFLIDAIAELNKITTVDFKVILTDNGPLLEEIKTKVKELEIANRIIFAGYTDEIKKYLWGSNLYINFSQTEALSMAILEALATGLPLIATNVGGTCDIINEKTNCGILVEYGDVNGMTAAINKLMNDAELCKTLSENARRVVKENFSLDNMVNGAYNLYSECVNCKK